MPVPGLSLLGLKRIRGFVSILRYINPIIIIIIIIEIFREFAQLCCLLQDMGNAQSAVTPLSDRITHCVQTKKYPKHSKSIQILYPVRSSNSSITKYKVHQK